MTTQPKTTDRIIYANTLTADQEKFVREALTSGGCPQLNIEAAIIDLNKMSPAAVAACIARIGG